MFRQLVTFMFTAALAAFLGGALPSAHDRWEFIGGGEYSDDTPGINFANSNVLVDGVFQTHDLEGTIGVPDQDWMLVPTVLRHSNEARVTGWSAIPSYGSCSNCAQVARVDFGGAVLTAASNPLGSNGGLFVRWTATATQSDYVRVTGVTAPSAANPTANDQYTIEFFDTTVFAPRFNNSGTQITVLFVQNTSQAAVTGGIYFYSAAGALVHTEPLNVAVRGLQVVNSAAIGALAGTSGSVAIAHNGGYGGITGKAVALEPATGFSLDTPLTSLPK